MKNYALELKWAINFSIASLLWMILEKTLGWHDQYLAKQMLYTNLFAFVAIAIFVFALLEKKKKDYKGIITWRQGFISGMILSFIIAVFSPLVNYITYTYITPGYFDKMINLIVSEKKQTIEQVTALYNMKSFIFQGISNGLSMGVTFGAIVAYFIQTKTTINEK
jgi:Protein of unknown function (DUF4199)